MASESIKPQHNTPTLNGHTLERIRNIGPSSKIIFVSRIRKFQRTEKVPMQTEKVVRIFPSSLDESIKLVEVLGSHPRFTFRVLGEHDRAFSSEQEALHYAQAKASEF